MNQLRRSRKINAEGRRRTMTDDPKTMADAELRAAIYRCQTWNANDRLRELVKELKSRLEGANR